MLHTCAARRVTGWILVVLNCIVNIGARGGGKYRILPTFNFPLNSPLDQGTGGGGQAESCQFPNQSNHPSPTNQSSPPSSQAPQTPSLESLHHQFDRFPMPPNFTHFYSYPIQTHNYNDVIRDYILTLRWTLIFDNIALNIVGSTLLYITREMQLPTRCAIKLFSKKIKSREMQSDVVNINI